MPVQKQQASVLLKLGPKLGSAVKAHKNDETDYGFTKLPPGVRAGIAKLTKCGFAVYKSGPNKDQPYFRAEGVALEPDSVVYAGQVRQVRGLTTSIMEPVCDTKKSNGEIVSLDEHIANVLNHMRMLGAETAELSTDGTKAAQELESLAAALASSETPIYFRFETSEKKDQKTQLPTGDCWENWKGNKGLEEYVPPESSGVEDDTDAVAAPSTNGDGEDMATAEEFSEFGDIDSLVERAEAKDEEAQKELMELALKAGSSQADVEAAENWQAVADLATGTVDATEEEAPEEAAEEEEESKPQPKKGDAVRYVPRDPKTGKPQIDPKTKKPRKAVDCEITAVDAKTDTATLKSLADGKTVWKGVKFDQLED